ncbi:non-canonical purine NTP pyrophosphatase [Oceanirhabdus seepicola]|uniref:non-canonical purine NTP pyrophosphatase n=1 Tax=Oceanirhabdus seepicola TaxID=2828781 RepID=UPI00203249B3|nr:non-canonical purine NTP pyrophosphatase [Oceanirhabdus seepicola]
MKDILIKTSDNKGSNGVQEIIFVTTNKGKIAYAQENLKNIKVLPYNAELIEPRSDDLKEIAKQKVIQAYNIVKKPCIALDAGFFIREWNGFPRAYVNPMLETIGIKGIIKLMEGIEDRYCEFRECLAYYDGIEIRFFESKSPGMISHSIRGKEKENQWSELWYIFEPKNFDKTIAEFNEEDFVEYQRLEEITCMKKFGDWYELQNK